ncbi:MAG: hypothetical protein DME83_07740, partial [Verrucomicrobia bacterium]
PVLSTPVPPDLLPRPRRLRTAHLPSKTILFPWLDFVVAETQIQENYLLPGLVARVIYQFIAFWVSPDKKPASR